MTHNVRLARPDDVEFLLEIDGLVSARPWSCAQFEVACDSNVAEPVPVSESVLVSEHGGRVCGFIIFSKVLEEACIHNLAVHPEQRSEGFGRGLVVAALALAKQQGVSCCQLEVRESNTAARGLYEALYFQTDGIRKNYYPTPTGREDALLMSRQL